jgi:hypothetical protein
MHTPGEGAVSQPAEAVAPPQETRQNEAVASKCEPVQWSAELLEPGNCGLAQLVIKLSDPLLPVVFEPVLRLPACPVPPVDVPVPGLRHKQRLVVPHTYGVVSEPQQDDGDCTPAHEVVMETRQALTRCLKREGWSNGGPVAVVVRDEGQPGP